MSCIRHRRDAGAPVFSDGKKAVTLRGEKIAEQLKALVEDYIEKRFGVRQSRAAE